MAGISTHVLNLTTGRPIAGMRVELYDVAQTPAQRITGSIDAGNVRAEGRTALRAERDAVVRKHLLLDLLADVAGLTRSVGFREPELQLSCVVGVGAGFRAFVGI